MGSVDSTKSVHVDTLWLLIVKKDAITKKRVYCNPRFVAQQWMMMMMQKSNAVICFPMLSGLWSVNIRMLVMLETEFIPLSRDVFFSRYVYHPRHRLIIVFPSWSGCCLVNFVNIVETLFSDYGVFSFAHLMLGGPFIVIIYSF